MYPYQSFLCPACVHHSLSCISSVEYDRSPYQAFSSNLSKSSSARKFTVMPPTKTNMEPAAPCRPALKSELVPLVFTTTKLEKEN